MFIVDENLAQSESLTHKMIYVLECYNLTPPQQCGAGYPQMHRALAPTKPSGPVHFVGNPRPQCLIAAQNEPPKARKAGV